MIADALKAAEAAFEIPVIEALKPDPMPEPAPIPSFIPKQGLRPDFRRITPVEKEGREIIPEPLPLPSFLLEPKYPAPAVKNKEDYTLEDVMAPDTTQLRCDMVTARALIDRAAKHRLSIKDTVRGMLGLSLDVRDEVIFEVPLSDEDYKELAMRYHIKASHRQEIQARMLQELRGRIERERSTSN